MAQKSKQYRGLIATFILLLAAVAAFLVLRNINQNKGQMIPPVSESSGDKGGAPVQDENGPGLTIRLSDGQSQPEVVEPLPVELGERSRRRGPARRSRSLSRSPLKKPPLVSLKVRWKCCATARKARSRWRLL